MAAVGYAVHPGSGYHVQDFYYGDDIDDATLRTITEESSVYGNVDDTDTLDDETALAIAIQESLESAQLEDYRKAFQGPTTLSRRDTLAGSPSTSGIPFPVSSSSSSSSDSAPYRRSRSRHRHSPLPSFTSTHPGSSSSSSRSISSSTSDSVSSSLPHNDTLNLDYSASGSTMSAAHAPVNLDEMARRSRRSSMATATQMLRRNLTLRTPGGAQTPYSRTVPVVASNVSSTGDLRVELAQYEKLLFKKDGPACLRCRSQTTVLPSVHAHHHNAQPGPFKLHSQLHFVCSQPTCGQVYCRGCFQAQSRHCSSHCFSSTETGRLCRTVSCCDSVRLIGLFEVLRHLEEVYLASHHLSSTSSAWEDRVEILFNTLHGLLSSSSSDDEQSTPLWHYAAPLLEVSLLRRILSILLQNANVKAWVTHSDLYLSTLRLLRTLTESDNERVRALVMDSPSASSHSSHLSPRPDYGISRWARERVNSESRYDTVIASASSVFPKQSQDSLYEIIQGLDAHRRALIDMKNRVNFPPTVEKLWGLADGLMYLVLAGLLL